ncbi:MAG TPA: hypothetical protein PKH43_01200 [Saprospiraceae bacterium]|nr:hypothetical protein [Saprospiraceae bacterium]
MHNRMNILLCLCLLCTAFTTQAQKPEDIETFYVFKTPTDSAAISVIRLESPEKLNLMQFNAGNFPAVMLNRSVFRKSLDIGNRNSRLSNRLQDEVNLLRQRDTINQLTILNLNQQLDLHVKQLEACEQHNAFLNKSIQTLDQQVDSSLELARESRKGLLGKKLWGIALGGGIGLGLGVLFGVIVAN